MPSSFMSFIRGPGSRREEKEGKKGTKEESYAAAVLQRNELITLVVVCTWFDGREWKGRP